MESIFISLSSLSYIFYPSVSQFKVLALHEIREEMFEIANFSPNL